MSEEKMDTIINRIKNRRNELMMSYQDLANKTGLSKSTLQRYETGSIKNMPLDKLGTLAKALNISPAYLMGWDESKEKTNSNNELNLSKAETTLLDNYNKLDKEDKTKVIDYTELLGNQDKYKEEEFIGMAAHNDYADDPEQQRLMQEDLDDL